MVLPLGRLEWPKQHLLGKEGLMSQIRILMVGVIALLAGGCTGSFRQVQGNVDQTATWPSVQSARSRPLLEAKGFAVTDFRIRRDQFCRVSVMGEVRNTGSTARAVELQATLRDRSGRVLAVGHFYPASYTNIQPNETWPFAYSFGREDDVTRAELRIVGSFRTMETVNVAYEAR